MANLLAPHGLDVAAPRGIPAKRLAIMRAALEIFLRDGYGATGIDAIATKAGVSKQTVYNHFGDKQRLFLAVVEAARAEVDAEQSIDDDLLRSPADLRNDLVQLGKQLLRVIMDPHIAALRRLLIAEAGRHPEINGGCGGASTGAAPRLVDWLTLRLVRLTVQGLLDTPDPERAAAQFVALMVYPGQQITNYGATPLTDQQMEELASAAADMFLRAYRRS
jgi:TetR/AcrR family transcriptional repressor of mexJK operon